jgi:dynein heavy chain
LKNLIDCITQNIYRNISRGLFEKDKILFSFLIATSINRQSKLISEEVWSIFTKGVPLAT